MGQYEHVESRSFDFFLLPPGASVVEGAMAEDARLEVRE